MLGENKFHSESNKYFKNSKAKRTVLLGLILMVLLGLLISLVLSKEKNVSATDNIESSVNEEEIPKEPTKSPVTLKEESYTSDMIFFPGFENSYEVNENTFINFGNEENNKDTIFLEYVISDESGTEIYRSEYIGADSCTTWSPSEYLSNGEHDIVLRTNAYETDGTAMVFKTFLVQEIKITIN